MSNFKVTIRVSLWALLIDAVERVYEKRLELLFSQFAECAQSAWVLSGNSSLIYK
jgi:hypothetical protein